MLNGLVLCGITIWIENRQTTVRNIASQIGEHGYQQFATLLPQTDTSHPCWAFYTWLNSEDAPINIPHVLGWENNTVTL